MNRDAVLSAVEYFPLDTAQRHARDLVELRTKIVQVGYTARGISEKLRIPAITVLSRVSHNVTLFRLWDRYVLDHETPLDILVRVFFLGIPEDASILTKVFSSRELSLLQSVGLLQEDVIGLASPVMLWPCEQMLIATDWIGEWHEADGREHRATRVMFLGPDSYSLASSLPRQLSGATLDLCTGSGVIALLEASRGGEVLGVDLNPRATNFATFNGLFNGLPNATFVHGDLFDGIVRSVPRYDFISANPPFVPTPKGESLMYRTGGPDGEAVLSRILGGCGSHLVPGGICQIVTQLVESSRLPYDAKLRTWLAQDSGFQCVVLRGDDSMTAFQHALAYSAESGSACARVGHIAAFDWVDAFMDAGVTSVGFGFILVRNMGEQPTTVTHLRNSFITSPFDSGLDISRRVFRALDELSATPFDTIRFGAVPVDRGDVTISTSTNHVELPYDVVEVMRILGEESLTLPELLERVDAEDGDGAKSALESAIKSFVVAGMLVTRPDHHEVPPNAGA